MFKFYFGTCRWCGEECHPEEYYHPFCLQEKEDEERFEAQRDEYIEERNNES